MLRLKSGRLKARMEYGEIKDHGRARTIAREIIPARLWKKPWHWTGPSFWQTGDLTFFNTPPDHFGRPIPGVPGSLAEYQGVRFDPSPFPQIPVQKDSPRRTGRRPKPWWDELLIEIARQLYEGELIPKQQADIEKAMHDWIIAHGHSSGETLVRQRAQPFWQAIDN